MHIFRGWHQTSKIKLRGILEYNIDAKDPWSAKIVSAKFLKTPICENRVPRKFGTTVLPTQLPAGNHCHAVFGTTVLPTQLPAGNHCHAMALLYYLPSCLLAITAMLWHYCITYPVACWQSLPCYGTTVLPTQLPAGNHCHAMALLYYLPSCLLAITAMQYLALLYYLPSCLLAITAMLWHYCITYPVACWQSLPCSIWHYCITYPVACWQSLPCGCNS